MFARIIVLSTIVATSVNEFGVKLSALKLFKLPSPNVAIALSNASKSLALIKSFSSSYVDAGIVNVSLVTVILFVIVPINM